MLLNALSQNFVISIPYNWIYPNVSQTWKPVLDRLYLNYNTCEDFLNSQITQVNFPGINQTPVSQQIRLYNVQKRSGLELTHLMQKQLTLTIKTTESYISYFMLRNQFDEYMKFIETKPLYLPPITVSILNDGGFETVSYVYKQITMTGISDLNLSYAATLGNFNTFTATFVYNYYDVYRVDGDGKRVLIATDTDPQLDFRKEHLDSDNPKYKEIQAVSTKNALQEAAMKMKKAESVQIDAVGDSVSQNISHGNVSADDVMNDFGLHSMSMNHGVNHILSTELRR